MDISDPQQTPDSDIDKINPDLRLISDYIGDSLPPHQRIAFEDRLASDPAFSALAAPLIAFSRGPHDLKLSERYGFTPPPVPNDRDPTG